MRAWLVIALSGGLLGAQAVAQTETVRVELRDAENRSVGHAVLRDAPNGTIVRLDLHGLPPGEHALHVHEAGKCAPPFESAGGHFNPGKKSHGFESAHGPHAGDLPNVFVHRDGTVQAELLVSGVRLATGAGAILDDDGAALVVHAGPDDYRTDPAGDSGGRIACGVIARAQ